jgi:hypothetical protein
VLAFTGLRPNALGTRPAISQATSEYTAGIFALRRRMTHGIDFSATYTLAKAHSVIGTAADELNSNNLQDATLLYDDPRVDGPTSRTDARHQGTLAGVFQLKGGFTVAPIFLFKSPLPVSTIDGRDLNLNSERNDLPARAFQYDGLNSDGTVNVKDIGECKTWNCGRGAWRTLMNLRVSKSFHLAGTSQIEAIGEVFNLFNGKNPSGFVTSQFFTSGAPNPDFMRPLNFSGDFQQPEQRVGQIGFRFSF